MTATAGDLLLDADTQLQLQGLDAARPALTAIDAVRQGSRDSPQLLYCLALACEGATILGDEARLHELSSRMEAAARQHGTTLTLALALCHAGVWDLLAGDLVQARGDRDPRGARRRGDPRGRPTCRDLVARGAGDRARWHLLLAKSHNDLGERQRQSRTGPAGRRRRKRRHGLASRNRAINVPLMTVNRGQLQVPAVNRNTRSTYMTGQ